MLKKRQEETKSLTIEQYDTNFKNAFNEFKGDSNIELGKMEKLENRRYSIILNSNIVLFADVNKNNKITSVNILLCLMQLMNIIMN